MDISEIMQLIKEAEEALLNMVIVFPGQMRHDETFLDLDASISELKAADAAQHDTIIIAVKEVQRCLSNFLRVHPEIAKEAKYKPILDDFSNAINKLLFSS